MSGLRAEAGAAKHAKLSSLSAGVSFFEPFLSTFLDEALHALANIFTLDCYLAHDALHQVPLVVELIRIVV